MMYTIYAYWNAEQITAMLNGIALIMNGGDFLGLIKAIAIAALLVSAGTALVKMRGEEPLGYFIMFAIFYGVLFVPRTTVSVQDLRTGATYTVANVPLGVGFFKSQTSHIGKWLTENYETYFTAVDDEKFSKNGMVFGARLIGELQQVTVTRPTLKNDLTTFVKDCVNPELLDKPSLMDDLVKAPDLWAYIGGSSGFSMNPGRATAVGGIGLPCTDAYVALGTLLVTEASTQAVNIGNRLNAGNAMASTLIMSQIPAIEGSLLNVSRSAVDAIKQGMVGNMLIDSQESIASQMSNAQTTAVRYATTSAFQSSNTSYMAMAKVAESALPKLRNGVELITLAVFPIVFLLVVAAGIKGGLVMRSYIMALIWVELWAPLYAVINYMMTSAARTDLMGVLKTTTGTLSANTLEVIGRLNSTAIDSQSIAGLLTISVPMIALALIKGGEVAMSGVVSSIMSPAQGSAQRSGDAASQGNINAGNMSWGTTSMNNWNSGNWGGGNSSFGNTSANKNDRSSGWSDPGRSDTTTPHGSYSTDGQGNVTGMSANNWNVGGTAGGSTNLGRSNAAVSGEGVRATTGRSSTLDLGAAATSGDQSQAAFARELSTALSSRMGTSNQFSNQNSAGSTAAASNERGGTSTLGNTENFAWNSRLGLDSGAQASQSYTPYAGPGGTNAGVPGQGAPAGGKNASQVPALAGDTSRAGPVQGRRTAGFDVGTGMSAGNAQALVDQATNKSGSVDSVKRDQAASMVMSAVNDVMKNSSDSGVKKAAQTFAADFQNAVRAGDQQSASVTKESSAGTTSQQGTSNQAGGSMALGAPVAQQLLAMAGGSPAKALELASNPAAVAQATQAAAAQFKDSSAGASFVSAGGATAPRSMNSVEQQGNSSVDQLSGKAHAVVEDANAGNKAAVQGMQHAPAGSTPSTTAAESGFNSVAGAVQSNYQQFAGGASQTKGAIDAAGALYAAEQKGAGTVMANAFGFGAGYQSPQQYQEALTSAAQSSPKLAATLQQIGNSGGKVSPEQIEYLQSELKAHGGK